MTKRKAKQYDAPVKTHGHLLSIVKELPQDYMPFGTVDYHDPVYEAHGQCSMDCKWYAKLAGDLGQDWGVCLNTASHRCGLLTFEHQGCLWFQREGTP